MTIKIEKKIVGYNLVSEEDKAKAAEVKAQEPAATIIQLGEPLSRPDKLVGNTYKIKTPVTEHALYITMIDDSSCCIFRFVVRGDSALRSVFGIIK